MGEPSTERELRDSFYHWSDPTTDAPCDNLTVASYISEILTLRAENDRLEKQVARFLEPVSDEEVKKHFWKQDPTTWGIRITYAEGVNALIANRMEPKGRPINPPQEPS